MFEELKKARDDMIENDITTLRDAAHVLEREGKAFQRDLYERITLYLDGMSNSKKPYIPKPFAPKADIEYKRPLLYAKVDEIRSKVDDEGLKHELFAMTWEIPDRSMEYLLLLFRDAISRFAGRHKNIFTDPPGVSEIQYYLSTLGITEVTPQPGDEFDPTWHVSADPQKKGFDYRINKTVHPGYKRNERRLLKAVVEVF